MNLVSCESCGIVLDLNMIKSISEEPWAETAKCKYSIGGKFEYITCPTCGYTMQRELKNE